MRKSGKNSLFWFLIHLPTLVFELFPKCWLTHLRFSVLCLSWATIFLRSVSRFRTLADGGHSRPVQQCTSRRTDSGNHPILNGLLGMLPALGGTLLSASCM
ncbi:hypothetical protein RvY_09172 [Ramazzottius varieornatus]|uniref:Uncharacterized protein n=1 Tax=Ramazzottius varieornatus TaxID=947166 RepID=A0A1D1VDZ0_RAMVA|nr:hypothetical protein RvY_09172 [Ramazzottius varieornatus]